jgi:hypothetical protein
MTTIEGTLLETLLHMSESSLVDFKQAAYPIEHATDEQKSELLKDILAFANAWKTSDAHILIGVAENAGGRGVVVGVEDHPNDAVLQQLVNSKTNRPVEFAYIPAVIDDKAVGVLRIAQAQQRPLFLKKRYGKLDAEVVFIRRGSSTAIASPDEVAQMGAAAVSVAQQPSVSLELCDPDQRTRLGLSVEVQSRILTEKPKPPPLSAAEKAVLRSAVGIVPAFALHVHGLRATTRRFDGPSKSAINAYRKDLGMLVRLGFVVHNSGPVLVDDLRVTLVVPRLEGLRLVDELPDEPVGPLQMKPIRFKPLHPTITTQVEEMAGEWELAARVGKVQPNGTVWSQPFWIGSDRARELSLKARIHADNISRELIFPVDVSINVVSEYLEDADDEDGDC